MILQAARLWRNGRRDIDERLCISLIGADAETEAMRLLDQHPALATICALDPHPLDSFRSSSAEWDEELGDLPALSTVYVCEEDEKAGLAASLAILEAAKPVHVVLAVKNHHVGAAAIIAEGELHELHPFGTHSSTLTEEIFVVGVNETLAEANHAHYLANESARGATTAENPSLVPWDHLDDALKESNRSFADGIGEKLEELNLAIVPSPLADPDRPVLVFTEEEIDQLAPMEHDRWRRDLEAQGWTHGNGAKDPVQLSHPQLVDWEELSREDRDKDRNAVRAIPAILARAGFDIVSVGDAEARHTSAAESRTEEGV